MAVLSPGLTYEKRFVVREEDTAAFLGSGGVAVLATPVMIAWMENVARLAIEERLPEGQTTVGTRVDVRHLRPAPLGARVTVRVELIEVRGRWLRFRVEARLGDQVVGEGMHERYVVDLQKFMNKVKQMVEKSQPGTTRSSP